MEIVFIGLEATLLYLSFMYYKKIKIQQKQEKFKNFLSTIIGIVVVIELLQFLMLFGAFDIDDVILNTISACIMFGILQLKSIKALVRKK